MAKQTLQEKSVNKQETASKPQTLPTKQKLTTNQKIMITGIAIVVLAIITVGLLLLFKPSGSGEAEKLAIPQGNVVLDDENVEDAIAELNRKAEEGMFEVKMNSNWTFPDGESPSTDASVANSSANRLPFYFVVTLSDTGEVIYTSPVIPVGSKITGFALTKDLDAGEYECVCTYNNLNEDESIANSASVAVNIIVQK